MTRPTLIIGNRNYSSWSLRAWLALRHLEVDFEERVVPLFRPPPEDHKAVLADLSPSGLVPLLIHADIKVWDSLAIAEYAAAELSEHDGWPTDPARSAIARSAAAEMHSGFADMRDALPMNVRARHRHVAQTGATQRQISRIQDIWGQCRALATEGGWLMGEFSIVDAMFAPVVFRFQSYNVSVDDVSRDYMDFVLADPVVGKWVAAAEAEPWTIDFAEVGT